MVNRLFPLYYNEYFNTVSAVLAERKECLFKDDIATKKYRIKGFTWLSVGAVFPFEWGKMTPNIFREVFGCLGDAKTYILGQTRFKNTNIFYRFKGKAR
ncbi:MAG: hypothetical protein WBM69_13265 [Desulfobacterales bacterium]